MFINKIGSKVFGTGKNNIFKKENNKETVNSNRDIESIKIEKVEKPDIESIVNKLNENAKNIHKIKTENVKPLLNNEINRLSNFRENILIDEIKKNNQEAIIDNSKIKKLKSIIGKNPKE
ncbi:MAG TPA: hypothetical protein PKW55_04885 [Spirochaetota bacterium]|nr:hypothetical protein [Spirochaetota bacterium]HOM37713.1 hypothetical protein [Spirochaetota bacterium]HPQ49671.1 hypothetical protein [Spirochaetota bacterium]